MISQWVRRGALLFTIAVAIGLSSTATRAATGLEQLLEDVRKSQQESSDVNSARENRFLREKSQQARLLQEAQATANEVERLSESLRTQFSENEKALESLKKTLAERTGDLGQIFAVVRQSAGDLKAVVDDSMVSGQLRDRAGFLNDLSQSRDLPPIKSLETLWVSYQEEMTASGQSVRFKADIVQADGRSEPGNVTRLGVFTALSEGEYLRYLPGTGRFQVLPRQPGYLHRRLATALHSAEAGPVMAVIDPTRGTILSLLIEKPNLKERVIQGGVVGYIIIGLGSLGVFFALLKLLYLLVVGGRMRRQLSRVDNPDVGNPLGRVLYAASSADRSDPESMELILDEAIIRETPRLERGHSILKLLAAVAPLLGLLGTVTGMILTFQAITLFGTGDPKLMAGGISQALMTTVLGLVVAIPLLFIHSLLASRSRALIQVLDEQSAGLLAGTLERRADDSATASSAMEASDDGPIRV